MLTPWQAGIWQCDQCRETLGVIDYTGQLWIKALTARSMEVYVNAVIVVCACGAHNTYYYTS